MARKIDEKHDAKGIILGAFRQSAAQELPTSTLVFAVYADDIKRIQKLLDDDAISTKQRNVLLAEKAKFHRRVLHHLNVLVADGVLSCTRVLAKGEKCYSPNLAQGEELIIQTKRRQILISRPSAPLVPMEAFEAQGIVHKVMDDLWSSRINALLVEGKLLTDHAMLKQVVLQSFSAVNDVVGVNHFEHLVYTDYLEDVLRSVGELNQDAKNYDKRVCLIIDITHIDDETTLVRFVNAIIKAQYTNVILVFDVTPREFLLHPSLFEQIINVYSRAGLKFNIKNDDILDSPLLIGKAGTYAFDDKEWKEYKKLTNPNLMLGCGLSSVVVDVGEFFEQHKEVARLHDCINNVAKSLFIANIQLRNRAEDLSRSLKGSSGLTKSYGVDLFSHSRNYIRLWNYTHIKNMDTVTVFQDLCQSLKNYSRTQQIIYHSCGMPIRFSCILSTAYKRFDNKKILPQVLSNAMTIKKTDELFSNETKEQLLQLEKIYASFEGTSEVRIQRAGHPSNQDVFREIMILLTTYILPAICVVFEQKDERVQMQTSLLGDDNA